MKFFIGYDLTLQTPYMYGKLPSREEDHIGREGEDGLWIQQFLQETNIPKEKGC